MTYLQELAANTLKIDRSFVTRLTSSKDSLNIVRAIVDLAHDLGMDVVAEGIETAEQAAALVSLGCEFGQGYLYASPLSAEAASQLIADGESVDVQPLVVVRS